MINFRNLFTKHTPILKKLNLSNGMEFMGVSAGKFLMGCEKYDDEKPLHTVDIPYDYWAARFPITNEQYNIYIKAKDIKHPISNWGNKKNHPIVNVTWNDAIGYCEWLNNLLKAELPLGMTVRLPTEAEWEKAARGTDGRKYPWGNTFDKNKCNSGKSGKNGTTFVGSHFPVGDSPYGCSDMSGNVWEWTHSLAKSYPYNLKDGREDENASGARVVRGGAYRFEVGDLRCMARQGLPPDVEINILGFRIVMCISPFETSLPKTNQINHESPKPVQVMTSKNKLVLSHNIEFMRIPAGDFLMGTENGNRYAKPQHTVDIPYDYWMARYPVTNELYNIYTEANGMKHPVSKLVKQKIDSWKTKRDHPVVYVNWTDASEYCNWLNNLIKDELPSGYSLRLPTEAEWEKAARGVDGREYPWGNIFDKNKCNTNEDELNGVLRADTKSIATYSLQGDSPYGCADMAGNVSEWTHSLMKAYPYKAKDGRENEHDDGEIDRPSRVRRGGSFPDSGRSARCANRDASDIDTTVFEIGFRVCLAPPLHK